MCRDDKGEAGRDNEEEDRGNKEEEEGVRDSVISSLEHCTLQNISVRRKNGRGRGGMGACQGLWTGIIR